MHASVHTTSSSRCHHDRLCRSSAFRTPQTAHVSHPRAYGRRSNLAAAASGGASCSSCPSNPEQQCTCGIVIVDHGSRRKASNDMLVEFCQLYQQLMQHPIVEPAHMEIAEPSIAQAVGESAAVIGCSQGLSPGSVHQLGRMEYRKACCAASPHPLACRQLLCMC